MRSRRSEDTAARIDRFEAVFRANVTRVRSYVARRTIEGVEDVVAETFTVAWRRLDDLPADALPWLLGVARRQLANQRRAERRRGMLHARLEREAPGFVIHADDDPRSAAVCTALIALSKRDREVLLLVERDGVSREDAARVLGTTRAQVRVRLHRARRRFAALYEQASQTPCPISPTLEGANDVRP
ncbi:MAG TPA: sigma-70 family RNA polymerase sigma factor [Gaiellaceae bacterium]